MLLAEYGKELFYALSITNHKNRPTNGQAVLHLCFFLFADKKDNNQSSNHKSY